MNLCSAAAVVRLSFKSVRRTIWNDDALYMIPSAQIWYESMHSQHIIRIIRDENNYLAQLLN